MMNVFKKVIAVVVMVLTVCAVPVANMAATSISVDFRMVRWGVNLETGMNEFVLEAQLYGTKCAKVTLWDTNGYGGALLYDDGNTALTGDRKANDGIYTIRVQYPNEIVGGLLVKAERSGVTVKSNAITLFGFFDESTATAREYQDMAALVQFNKKIHNEIAKKGITSYSAQYSYYMNALKSAPKDSKGKDIIYKSWTYYDKADRIYVQFMNGYIGIIQLAK